MILYSLLEENVKVEGIQLNLFGLNKKKLQSSIPSPMWLIKVKPKCYFFHLENNLHNYVFIEWHISNHLSRQKCHTFLFTFHVSVDKSTTLVRTRLKMALDYWEWLLWRQRKSWLCCCKCYCFPPLMLASWEKLMKVCIYYCWRESIYWI